MDVVTSPARISGRPLAVWIYSGLLALIGIVLIAGGTRLLSLGGSSYYLIAGLLTTASGWLTWRGKRLGAWLYGVLLVSPPTGRARCPCRIRSWPAGWTWSSWPRH